MLISATSFKVASSIGILLMFCLILCGLGGYDTPPFLLAFTGFVFVLLLLSLVVAFISLIWGI